MDNKKRLGELVAEVVELLSTGEHTKTSACRKIAKENDYYYDTLRRAINKKQAKLKHKALTNESEVQGFPFENVSSYWLKSKHISVHVKGEDKSTIDYTNVIKEIIESFSWGSLRTIEKDTFVTPRAIKATLSDMHVGLEPNPHNKAIFAYEYNEDIFRSNLNKVYNSILKEYESNGKFDLLIIDDLGDGLDGWNSLTTRGGHKLDQNMTNEEMFKVFVEGKLTLIENCINLGVANKVLVRNVCNDNHGGSYSSIANIAIQMILNRVYDSQDVDFYVLNKFIEHFEYGEHTFIVTHGKDSQYMFKGLPYELNDKAIAFINDYIDHYNIKTRFIHLEKGDLHRVGYSRTKKFDYRNFMSFAPPSAWVQHNFGDCYSGYSIQVINKDNGEIAHTDYYFDLKKQL